MTNTRGFGLLLVVVVLTLLGLLSLGAFAVARRELRATTDLGFAAQAFEAAESGLAVAATAAGGFGTAPPLVPQVGPAGFVGQGHYATTILRLNESLWLVTSVGERVDGTGEVLARRSLGLVGKLVPDSGSSSFRFRPLAARRWAQLYR